MLRTLLVNALFVGGMMLFARRRRCGRSRMRGDWMFDGYTGAAVETFRGWLLGLADHLESHAHEDHFGTSDKAPEPTPTPDAGDRRPRLCPRTTKPADTWPLPDAADPLVANMPADVQLSIDSVGMYLREHFPDPRSA